MNDDELRRLIHLAGERTSPDADIPSDEIVQRYLLGIATLREKRMVRDALEESSAFRQELREMTAAVDHAAEVNASTQFSLRTPSRSVWRKRATIIIPLALAALVVLSFAIDQFVGPDSGWTLVEKNIEPERLIAMITRGSSEVRESYPTGKEAALAEFRNVLLWTDSGFIIRDHESRPDSSGRRISATIVSTAGAHLGSWTRHVPGSEVSIWVLTIPSRDLRRFDLQTDNSDITWESDWGDYGCLTWIYQTTTGYSALSAVALGKPQ